MDVLTIGIDFDGTCVEHRWPDIGIDVPNAVRVIHRIALAGHKIVLWTMRDGKELQDAVDWFASHDIELHGVNKNPDQDWSTSPKAYCHYYIDDAALGCPLMQSRRMSARPMVDWLAVEKLLIERKVIDEHPSPVALLLSGQQ